ncbi:MAG: helix-turn-helix transcriptional regulator [Rhodocyclaceae bacterium]|nr:helix-turn-helix transcriptional regulator [Rhodocyclaceae bacterium]
MSKIRAARVAKGLTLRQVADMSGLDPSSVSRIERGLLGTRPDSARRLGAVLGIDAADIVLMERNGAAEAVEEKSA